MANRVPLILDIQDQNRIRELPVGDNLDLTGSSIINVTNLEVLGNLTAAGVSVDYNLLLNKPSIPSVLTDLSITDGTANQVLSTDGAGNFTFTDPVTVALNVSKLSELQNDTGFITQADLANGTYEIKNIGSLVGSVFAEDSTLLVDGINGTIDYNVLINTPTIPTDIKNLNDSLGLLGGSFSGSYNDLTDKPFFFNNTAQSTFLASGGGSFNVNVVGNTLEFQFTPAAVPTLLSELTNDVGFITTETDSQTLTFDGTNLTISNGNSVNLSSLAVTVDTGNIGFDANTIYNLEVGTEPILIAPDLGDGDASIYLPASNSAETLLISNDSGGGVSITGNAGDIVVNSANNVDIESVSSSGRINFNINGTTEAWVDSTGFNVGILTGNLEGNITGNVTASTVTATTITHNVANSTELTIGATTTTNAKLRSGTSSVNISDDNTGSGVITITAPNVDVVGTLSATAISSTGTGTSELIATTNLELSAGVAVVITQSPFRLASFTTTARDLLIAVNGDMIYNETVNKFQGYQNGAWINLDGTV